MDPYPHFDWLTRRRCLEKTVALSVHALRGVAVLMLGVLILACVYSIPLVWTEALLWTVPAIWVGTVLFLVVSHFRKPSPAEVAKRADKVLGLPDDFLALSEFPTSESASQWRTAAWRQAESACSPVRSSWPIQFPRHYALNTVLAVGLAFAAMGIVWHSRQAEVGRQFEIAQAKEERVKAAEDILKDWEEFTKETPDPELKKLFGEAAKLREAVQSGDPMDAMLTMNQIEAKMASLQESLTAQSLSPQAERIAEALESFGGMGAMSAALRNKNFESAAKEAEKLAQKLAKDPSGATALRRGEAVAEMLAKESASAQKRGNSPLSEALSQLSSSASKNAKTGQVPNEQVSPATKAMKDQFSKEAAFQNRGRMVSTGKSQLDALRSKLRGESGEAPPSLCKGNGDSKSGKQPGGNQAGTEPGGKPEGDPTNLADAGKSEHLTGTLGDEGESETTASSTKSGTATQTSAGTKADLSEYLALSEKAVADEALPLAHRRTIRSYFERIRPVAETKSP